MADKIKSINDFVSTELWFDFQIKSFDGGTLIVVGGTDLYNNALIEIKFNNVAYISLRSDWKTKDNLNAIDSVSEEKEKVIRETNFIEDIYSIFAFNHHDTDKQGNNQYIVAATDLEYKINKSP